MEKLYHGMDDRRADCDRNVSPDGYSSGIPPMIADFFNNFDDRQYESGVFGFMEINWASDYIQRFPRIIPLDAARDTLFVQMGFRDTMEGL
jgi:hypothetical protein